MKPLKLWKVQNRFIAILFVLLLIEVVLYLLFAHQLIESTYKGESITFFNNYFSGREANSLNFYTNKTDKLFFALNLIGLFLIQSLSFSFRLLGQRKRLVYLVEKEIRTLKISLYENNRAVFFLISLFFLFFCLYFVLGTTLILNRQIYTFSFFGADPMDYINDWNSIEWNYTHKGSHPLILLICDPLGTLLYYLTSSKEISVIILNSFFGALAVLLSSIFFWILTRRYVETAILTNVFGLSMSQLVFSTVPETYALAGCSVITTYILFLICLNSHKLYIGYWILAGIFSFGVTITNFAQTLICFTVAALSLKNEKRIIAILDYISTVVSCTFLLSIFQWRIFPYSKLFFLPLTVEWELKSIKETLFSQPLLVIKELIKHFFLVNFVASSPFTGIVDPENSSRLLLGFYERSLEYNIIGFIGIVLWVCLFTIGLYKNILTIKKNVFIIGVCFSILFNIALHSFFGTFEMFLYTCNFIFPVLLLAINNSIMKRTYFKISLAILIILMGINNLLIMNQIIST